MISVLMPFWNRAGALRKTLLSFREHYNGLEYEVVVVDDGSTITPARCTVDEFGDLNIHLVELGKKTEPKNPCVPMNIAAGAAKGDFYLLTSPEVLHESAIMGEMRREIAFRGPKTCVIAAVRCEKRGWVSHSNHAPFKYHFCNMLHSDLYWDAAGFDERYRDGYCFDDPDFVKRLEKAGVEWSWRDDLLATHQHDGPKHRPPRDLWHRNRKIYVEKWGGPPERE